MGSMVHAWLLDEFKNQDALDTMTLYHLGTGGKCLRGQLALAEAQAHGLDPTCAKHWAVACELLHNATLIHDDIQDNDPLRRGQTSLWKKFGIPQAINVGDYLIFRSFQIVARLNEPKLIVHFAQTSELLVRGQCDELLANQPDLQKSSLWENYLSMVTNKTGALFQLPIHGVHILKNIAWTPDVEKAWLEFGVAYQIFDDLRDYLGLKQQGQKQKDFAERRVNAVVAYLSLNPKNQGLLDEYLAPKSKIHANPKNFLSLFQTTVEEQRVLHCLQELASHRLKYFCEQTHPETQKIMMKFLLTALPIDEVRNHVVVQV